MLDELQIFKPRIDIKLFYTKLHVHSIVTKPLNEYKGPKLTDRAQRQSLEKLVSDL